MLISSDPQSPITVPQPDHVSRHWSRQFAAPKVASDDDEAPAVAGEQPWLNDQMRSILGDDSIRSRTEYMRLIGGRMARARAAVGLQSAEMAQIIGHTNGSKVSLWENGLRMPTLEGIVRYAAVCGVSVDYLAGICSEEAPDYYVAGRREAVKHARQCINEVALLIGDLSVGVSLRVSEVERNWRLLHGQFAELVHVLSIVREHNGDLFDCELYGGARLLAVIDRVVDAFAAMEATSGAPDQLRGDLVAARQRLTGGDQIRVPHPCTTTPAASAPPQNLHHHPRSFCVPTPAESAPLLP